MRYAVLFDLGFRVTAWLNIVSICTADTQQFDLSVSNQQNRFINNNILLEDLND